LEEDDGSVVVVTTAGKAGLNRNKEVEVAVVDNERMR
jgi:hypothetical protein